MGIFGEQDRSAELLWGRSKAHHARARAGLSAERIVSAAIQIADDEGLTAVSMQRVASEFGVTPMALYRHVLGKAELLDLALDTAIGPPPKLDGVEGWRAKLELWAREDWRLFHQHPWTLQMTTNRRLMGPNELAWMEAALSALTDAGFAGRDLIELTMVVVAYVRSAAQNSLDITQGTRRTGLNEAEWWSGYGALLDGYGDGNQYPILRAALESGAFHNGDDLLAFGLGRLFDGIEALIGSMAAPI